MIFLEQKRYYRLFSIFRSHCKTCGNCTFGRAKPFVSSVLVAVLKHAIYRPPKMTAYGLPIGNTTKVTCQMAELSQPASHSFIPICRLRSHCQRGPYTVCSSNVLPRHLLRKAFDISGCRLFTYSLLGCFCKPQIQQDNCASSLPWFA
jgi:hypothetical protein